MDFLNAIDQAIRHIKREVNLKVFKVPEIKQQVIDTTNDEPWGPHGSDLIKIANATRNHEECHMVMDVIWVRLSTTNRRIIYKSLTVIEYLISNGSDRAVDEIINQGFQIFSILGLCCAEPNGKEANDVGMNVKKKAKTILCLLNDREKIKQLRDKAFANRDKCAGVSKVLRYKLGTDSNISRCAYQNSYDTREDQLFRYSHNNYDAIYTEDTCKNITHKPQRNYTQYIIGNNPKIEASHVDRNEPDCCITTMKLSSVQHSNPSTQISSSTISNDDEFDPRGYSTIGSIHLQETSITDNFNPRGSNTEPYVSYLQEPVKTTVLQTWDEVKVDLFDQHEVPTSFPVKVDLFDQQFIAKSLKPESSDNLTELDLFGSSKSLGSQNEAKSTVENTTNTVNDKKAFFRVKSKIWADELSSGLINLNITSSDQPAKPCMGKSMGVISQSTIGSSAIS